MTTESPLSKVARSVRKVATVLLGVLWLGACSADYGDPGPSFGAFEYTMHSKATYTKVVVVVVDDRALPGATLLRTNLEAAARAFTLDRLEVLDVGWSDAAIWHPIDVRFVLVPASSPSLDSIVHPGTHRQLAWISNQASEEGGNVLARAVGRNVAQMKETNDPFRPLEAARRVVSLLTGARTAATVAERALLESTSSRRRFRVNHVAILAGSDDASADDAQSYKFDRFDVDMNAITSEGTRWGRPDPARFPRLAAWVGQTSGPYTDTPDRPYGLVTWWSIRSHPRCEDYPIAEISPGIGDCHIEITTVDPDECDPSRGWADPRDSDGVRRARHDERGERVCEMVPVLPEHMPACVSDPLCTDCGGGWCVSKVWTPSALSCPGRRASTRLRYIGGALPDPGKITVVCRGAE